MKSSILRHKVRIKPDPLKLRRVSRMSMMHKIPKLTRYWLRKMMNKDPNNELRGGILETEEEELRGVSSQKRVKIRAEQLFNEAQAIKTAQTNVMEQKRTRKLDKDDKDTLKQL
eukprot:12998736-Heterocapsa_arctica.AAC.1